MMLIRAQHEAESICCCSGLSRGASTAYLKDHGLAPIAVGIIRLREELIHPPFLVLRRRRAQPDARDCPRLPRAGHNLSGLRHRPLGLSDEPILLVCQAERLQHDDVRVGPDHPSIVTAATHRYAYPSQARGLAPRRHRLNFCRPPKFGRYLARKKCRSRAFSATGAARRSGPPSP